MVRIALLLALVAALASAFVGSSSAAPARLTATVGPGYTITLKKGATTVRTLERAELPPARHGQPHALERRLERHEDDEARAQARPLHVRVRPARGRDAR